MILARNRRKMQHRLQYPTRITKYQKYRFMIYTIVIVVMILMMNGMPVFASLGDYEIQDLYQSITDNVSETNSLLNKAFKFSQVSPYTIVNGIAGSAQGNIAVAVRNATKSMALVVATILLMVDFFKKSITFEWSSKWENILLFLIKLIVVKQVVQNADTIVSYIYAGFQTINDAAVGTDINFLPCGNTHNYIMYAPYRGDTWYEWGFSLVWHEDLPNDYKISLDAVRMFYPDASLPYPGTYQPDDFPFESPTGNLNFVPLVADLLLQPYFWILKALAIIIFVVTIGRVFELSVYTIFAPLPLVTFASDTTHDIAKNFIKNYIATVLQVTVIVVMFIVYVALNKYFTTESTYGFTGVRLIQFVELGALGLGVIKSGAWSKKICGIG